MSEQKEVLLASNNPDIHFALDIVSELSVEEQASYIMKLYFNLVIDKTTSDT